jgi:hypothetical protein
MALLNSLFIRLESRKFLLLSHATFFGSDAVSLLHLLMFRAFAIRHAVAYVDPTSVSNNPCSLLIVRIIVSSGIVSSGFWSYALTELPITL